MADTRAASDHQFERDLREIRLARGVSLTEVQNETRIPADVLDRFEAGDLVGDPNYNEVYLRNLLKAYSGALGLASSSVLKAYDASKAGTYGGELKQLLAPAAPKESRPEKPSPEPKAADTAPEVEKPSREEPSPPAEERISAEPPAKSAAPPAVAALSTPDRPAKPEPAPAPKQETKARVQSRESVTSSTSAIEASWGLIIAGTLAAIIVIGGVLWFMLRPDTPDVEPTDPVATVVEDEPDDEAADPEDDAPVGDAPRLEIPIQVTVIAEDGPLGGADGFRITEEPDARRPYWIEQGESQTFSSETEVIVWGTETAGTYGIPAEARLRLQGYTWQPEPGSVLRIDQQRGQALLDSLHRAQRGTGG